MTLPLIPRPNQLERHSGAFPLSALQGMQTSGTSALQAARWLQARLKNTGGPDLKADIYTITHADLGRGETTPLRITEDAQLTHPEGYHLSISAHGLHLRGQAAGLMRGAATLAQLLEAGPSELPHLDIQDAPRFGYRGFMLDVSRHFMPLEEVKTLIDELAALKLNTFHWHLTDDHGWRLEIKRYPRLTEVGAWRRRTLKGHASAQPPVFDDTPHGGYYTQDEIRELVAYAAERHISVIPEIDLPGHAQAAQAAYPELSCFRQPLEVWDRWGINYEVLCTRDQTFTFLQGVLEEVMALFPSRTIHLGGDEVETDHWARCPDCQAVMQREGFTQVKQLEGYFTGRIATHLSSQGVRVIGWDEITEGPLPPGVTVMSWRGFEGGMNAARRGFNVIMCPQSHVYLDHYQGNKETEPLAIGGFSDLPKTYSFEPVPPELTPQQVPLILGGQANLWREYIPDTPHAQYMMFPRLHAVAEALWTQPEGRDWADFRQRLPGVLEGLRRRGVNFRPLDADASQTA